MKTIAKQRLMIDPKAQTAVAAVAVLFPLTSMMKEKTMNLDHRDAAAIWPADETPAPKQKRIRWTPPPWKETRLSMQKKSCPRDKQNYERFDSGSGGGEIGWSFQWSIGWRSGWGTRGWMMIFRFGRGLKLWDKLKTRFTKKDEIRFLCFWMECYSILAATSAYTVKEVKTKNDFRISEKLF